MTNQNTKWGKISQSFIDSSLDNILSLDDNSIFSELILDNVIEDFLYILELIFSA